MPPNDPLLLDRAVLLTNILKSVADHQSVIVVSPSGSGKTSLCHLLAPALADRCWCLIPGTKFDKLTDQNTAEQLLVSIVRAKYPAVRTMDDVLARVDLLLFDDAQCVYASRLFCSLITSHAYARTRLLAFASYSPEYSNLPAPLPFSFKVCQCAWRHPPNCIMLALAY